MDEVLVGVLDDLLRDGTPVSPRGLPTKELLAYGFELVNPRARRIAHVRRGWSESLAVGELCWHLAGSDDARTLSYYAPAWADFSDDGHRIAGSCYGKRIFGGVSPTQWDRVHSALRTDRDSRRAVLVLAESGVDLGSARDVACISTIQFVLRRGRLNCSVYMRSCDAMWGLCYDVFLCTMLQELMAVQLGVDVGTYHHHAASLHVYERFLPKAISIVDAGLQTAAPPMPQMEGIDCIPAFLATEAALRTNQSDASESVAVLPTYWRELAAPLQRLRERRFKG